MDSIELLHHFDLYIFRCARSSAVLKKNFGQSSLIVAVNPILEGDFLAEIDSNNGQLTKEATAFHLATLANELKAQLDWLKETLEYIESWGRAAPVWFLEQISGPVHSGLQKLRSYLMPLLKRFLSKVWQVISHMLTPKEWKLTGQVGTGILGLADVGIEITFGP